VALSLLLSINTSVDNSWSDFLSDHTWSLVQDVDSSLSEEMLLM